MFLRFGVSPWSGQGTGRLRRRGFGQLPKTKGTVEPELTLAFHSTTSSLQQVICLIKTYHSAACIQWRAVRHIESVGVIKERKKICQWWNSKIESAQAQ